MKKIIILLLILSSIYSYSQNFCDYGEYNILFNIIKGYSKPIYKKITKKKYDKILYKIEYDSFGRIRNSSYNESYDNLISLDNPCYSTDEEHIKTFIKYSYNKNYNANIVYIKANKNKTIKKAIIEYSKSRPIKINLNDFEIKYCYYENGLIKSIEKFNTLNEFYWNKNRLLTKIIVNPTENPFQKIINIEYNKNNKIKKIIEIFDYQDLETLKFVYKYNYNSDKKIKEIVREIYNSKSNIKKRYLFSYCKLNKLKIFIYDNNKYIEHFICEY